MRLPIYSSREYLPEGVRHVLPLYPFWGAPPDPPWPRPEFADALIARGAEFLELTDLADSDVAIYPQDWKWARLSDGGDDRIGRFLERSRGDGKPVAFFWASDRPGPTAPNGAFVFQPSLYRTLRGQRDFAVPGFHEDLLQYCGGVLPVRHRPTRATVGFCGFVQRPPEPRGLPAQARRALGEVRRRVAVRRGQPLLEDIYVRGVALESLERQQHVDTNIIYRDDYNGGVATPTDDLALWQERRDEYVENMIDSDYVVCSRGTGNYSYRLYEALSLGRIPVFVDTDCVLPYDFAIDWHSYGVWLDRRSVKHIGERVAEFHAALSDDDFVELQRRCRLLWEEYLSPLGFFSKFHLHFTERPREGASL